MITDDMTEAELVTADPQRLIDRECAERGIPLLPQHPGEAPKPPPKAEPDKHLWEVPAINLTSADDAARLAEFVGTMERAELGFDYKSTESCYYVLRLTRAPLTLTRQSVFSAKPPADTPETAAYAQARKDYDERVEKYDDVDKQRVAVAAEVGQAIHAAIARERERAQHIANFDAYLELADRDRVVARRFFEKAYPDAVERFPELDGLFS